MLRTIPILFLLALAAPAGVCAQGAAAQTPSFTADYPTGRPGFFIQSSTWMEMPSAMPFKTKAARVFAASLSYGLVPAKVVAEYRGDHAVVEVNSGQPAICICRIISLPGKPVIVRLHPKKDSRELDGGKMIVYPIAGGSKMADADKSDLIPVDVAQPDPQVWLVRPHAALPPGEFALMLGTQNLNIFPFTVVQAPANSGAGK